MSEPLTTARIADAVRRIHRKIDGIREELDAADRVLGDGDTGMTVASVVAAWNGALASESSDVAAMLQQLGRETRRATGSSLGSVMAMGLIAAGKIGGTSPAAMLDAASAAITERAGAAAGDKTILDSLLAIERAFATADDAADALDGAIGAAETARGDFRDRRVKRIRAQRRRGSVDLGGGMLDHFGLALFVLHLRLA